MFIRTILIMQDDELPRQIFCERARMYFNDEIVGQENRYDSSVFDLLNVCSTFGMLIYVRNMIDRNHIYPKHIWKGMIWKRGWELEDVYWRIEKQLHRSLDLLCGVSTSTRYLPWWTISDKYPGCVRDCEILVKLTCHASTLRGDDFKLKNQAGIVKMCTLCNSFEIEDVRHFLLRCPYFHCERTNMLNEIEQIRDGSGIVYFDYNVDMVYRLLGSPHGDLNEAQIERSLLIILKYIPDMYRKNMKQKRGIG